MDKVTSERRDHFHNLSIDEKTDGTQTVQQKLSRQVQDTISHYESFGEWIELLLDEMGKIDENASPVNLRQKLVSGLYQLQREHGRLASKLDGAQQYLLAMEKNSESLHDEINRMRLLSLTDELTGLANRRAFLRRLEEEVERAQRYDYNLTLALIDLDFFKRVNDRFGHASGDEVLRKYADNILSAFRHSDLVARYGGEEFAVLMPNTDLDGTIKALEKTSNVACQSQWLFQGEALPMPTFSAGIAVYRPDESPNAFIERSDNALYKAKRAGRNRIEVDTTHGSFLNRMQHGNSGY